jgi:perosamine synthetase
MELRKEMLSVLRPLGGDEEVEAIRESIESGWWTRGPKVEQFEKEFAELVGSKYAVAVTSNSHGQDLVMKALGMKDVDVINPTISFMATAIVPIWNNCTSNIVDVRRHDLNIDPVDVKKSLKKDTKVIIAVNMAGIPAPIDEIREFYDGYIIEDCAHSAYTPGAGTKGDIAVWSFQAVKTMPIGDGGMITTDDYELYKKLQSLAWFGIESTYSRISGKTHFNADKKELIQSSNKNPDGKPGYTWDYDVTELGYKYYMIDILAAIGLVQLKKLDKHLEIRRHIQSRYNDELSGIIEPPAWSETVQYYCSRVPAEHRDSLIDYLKSKMIHTSVHFKPLHLYDIVKQNREYPVADDEWQKLLSLPVHPAMNDQDIDYVIYWVKKYFEDFG